MSDPLPMPIDWSAMLHQAWLDAGRPSYREIARLTGVSHETIRQAIQGYKVARRPTVEAIAGVLCERDVAERILNRWDLDQEQARPGQVAGAIGPSNTLWMIMPEELYGPVHEFFNILGYDVRLLGGKTWAVLPTEGDKT